MDIEEIRRMSADDLFKLQALVDKEANDRARIAEYTDRFRELFADAKRDGIALGIYNVMTGDVIKARDRDHLFVGKWQG